MKMGPKQRLKLLEWMTESSKGIRLSNDKEKLIKDAVGEPACPHCGSKNIVKKGMKHGSQYFKCKDCGRGFSLPHSTSLRHLRITADQLRTLLDLMLGDSSLRSISRKLGVSFQTVFSWRKAVMEAMVGFEDDVKLSGTIVYDTTYMRHSEKGVKGAHNAYRSDGKNRRGISRDQIGILCAVDGGIHSLVKVLGKGKETGASVISALTNHVVAGSLLVSDKYTQHVEVAQSLGCRHESYKLKEDKEYGEKMGPINNFHSELKAFLTKYYPSTKDLPYYLAWFQFRWSMKQAGREADVEKEALIRYIRGGEQ
jgi:transposase-like protein